MESSGSEDNIKRHPALRSAFEMELVDYVDALTFEYEHQLTKEPLRIDVLIVKKKDNVEIEKNIGAIFKGHNLVEYKSPTDYISVNDFYKFYGYAMIYLSLEKHVEISDITLTLDAKVYPRELVKHLQNERGYEITKRYPGIYYVTGDIIPIQIIESKKLSEEENLFLRSLDNEVNLETMKIISAEAEKYKEEIDTDAYMDVVIHANTHLIEEELKVLHTSMETIIGNAVDDWEKRGFVPEFIKAREERTKLEAAIALIEDGMTVEAVSRALKLPIEKIQTYIPHVSQ
jgi:hypothetical protein